MSARFIVVRDERPGSGVTPVKQFRRRGRAVKYISGLRGVRWRGHYILTPEEVVAVNADPSQNMLGNMLDFTLDYALPEKPTRTTRAIRVLR